MRRLALATATITLAIGVLGAALPASAAARRPAVVIREIFYNSPGPDNRSNASLNHEWVQLVNRSNHRVRLHGWTLRDASRHVYTFGTFTLRAHASVKVRTGRGTDNRSSVFQGRRAYVWNNDGDRATLKGPAGNIRGRCSYSDPNEVNAFKIC